MHDWLFKFFIGVHSYTSLAFPYIVLLCVILALAGLVRPVKGLAAVALVFCSYGLGLNMWIAACVYSLAFASLFWFIIGVFIAGIGVFPLSIIVLAIHGEWETSGLMMLGLLFVWGFRALGIRYAYVVDSEQMG